MFLKIGHFLFYSLLIIFFGCKKIDTEELPPPPPPPPPSKVPLMLTEPISDLTVFSVKIKGKILDTVGSNVFEQGFVVDTFPNPTISKNLSKFPLPKNSNGGFETIITEIPGNKTYYLRSYGKNSFGVGYGNEIKFTSLPEKIFNGSAHLRSQAEVIAFGANQYTKIVEYIYISGNVRDLSPLNTIAVIGGIEIKGTLITNLRGLENLEAIGVEYPFPVWGGVRIENNPNLTNFTGLDKFWLELGNFYVLNNDALVDFSGLEKLLLIGHGELRIQGCDNLRSLNGFNGLNFMRGSGGIFIADNPQLTNLSGLNGLTEVDNRITIVNNNSLEDFNGLENVRALYIVEFTNNPSLVSLTGLRNVESIFGFVIKNNDRLTDLSVFNNIKGTQGIDIRDNDLLATLDGFRNVEEIQGELRIENNSSFIDMRGLEKLKKVNKLQILANPNLRDLRGLDSLSSMLGQVYAITIWSNDRLQSLSGLQNLRTVWGSIQISRNFLLTDFCALKPLFVAGWNDFFLTENNGINPTRTQVINTCR